MSATSGISNPAERTSLAISPRACAARTFGAVIRTISQPASASSIVCLTVPATFNVSVVVIDWMRTGCRPPIGIFPIDTMREFRRIDWKREAQ